MSSKPVASLFLLCFVVFGSTTTLAAPDAPRISLLTFQPGTVYWQRFGHNALLVRDDGRQIAYNYGIFDFAQENFMLNFAAGRMQYQLAAQPLAQALYPYQVEGRWAVEQRLNLAPDEATSLAKFLAWNARPENAEYRYDYFIANCSTRVRDALNRALSGRLKQQLAARDGEFTYREQVVRVSAPDPWLMFGMDLGLGPRADAPTSLWQESFIPGVLMRALREVTRADGTPLVASEQLLLRGSLPEEPERPPVFWPWFLAAGLILAILLLALGAHRTTATARVSLALLASFIMLVCGLGGLVLAALWGLTEHWASYYNRNLLLLNPLCLLLVPLWLSAMGRDWLASRFSRWLAVLIAAGAGGALLLHLNPDMLYPGIAQANLHWIALLLPVHSALAWIASRRDPNLL